MDLRVPWRVRSRINTRERECDHIYIVSSSLWRRWLLLFISFRLRLACFFSGPIWISDFCTFRFTWHHFLMQRMTLALALHAIAGRWWIAIYVHSHIYLFIILCEGVIRPNDGMTESSIKRRHEFSISLQSSAVVDVCFCFVFSLSIQNNCHIITFRIQFPIQMHHQSFITHGFSFDFRLKTNFLTNFT